MVTSSAKQADAVMEHEVRERAVRGQWSGLVDQGLFLAFASQNEQELRARLPNVVEQLIMYGRDGTPLGLVFAAGAHMFAVMSVVRKFAPIQHRQRWLGELGSGRSIGAIAVAEPSGGSDAFALETLARKQDGGYVVSGRKRTVTNACTCDLALVFARDPETNKIICLAIPSSAPGFTSRARTELVGLDGSGVGDLELADCHVPDEFVIATGQRAKWAFMHAMEWERGLILAPTIGRMQRQLADSVEWLHARRRGALSMTDHQVVRHRLATMQLRLHHCELLLEHFVRLKQQGQSGFSAASEVKTVLSESFVHNSLDAIALYGSWGYDKGCSAQADLTDAMGFLAASGPNDIQRDIIGAALLRGAT